MNDILLYTILALMIVAIVLLIALLVRKPKKDNTEALLGQKIDMTSKASNEKLDNLTRATDGKLERISQQMKELTDKNYEQQIKLIETLNINTEKQTKATSDAIGSMPVSYTHLTLPTKA